MIEESDGDETKNQVGASPEPDVLMKHIEYDDSNNKQDFFHGREKVSGDTEKHKSLATKRHIRHKTDFWMANDYLCVMCFLRLDLLFWL